MSFNCGIRHQMQRCLQAAWPFPQAPRDPFGDVGQLCIIDCISIQSLIFQNLENHVSKTMPAVLTIVVFVRRTDGRTASSAARRADARAGARKDWRTNERWRYGGIP